MSGDGSVCGGGPKGAPRQVAKAVADSKSATAIHKPTVDFLPAERGISPCMGNGLASLRQISCAAPRFRGLRRI